MEPELEDGEVKFCPDCNMLLEPFLTYCPNCGTLARVRQTQSEPPRLMLSRYAVYVAGGFSLVSILAYLFAMLAAMTFYDSRLNPYWRTDAVADWLRFAILIFFIVSMLMGLVVASYSYEAAHRRWNTERLRSVVLSSKLLIFLGSLNLLLGFVIQSIQTSLSKEWWSGTLMTSMTPPFLWATGAFMIVLSLPGLVIATRGLKREEAETSPILG